MKDIWVISDTHFNHSNIIKFCNRPFENVRQMDEKLIENWNSVVKKGDKVYHLGDVYFNASKGYIEHILQRLNGNKRLIIGNHDNGKDQILQRYFEKIILWRDFKEFGILLSHVPIQENSIIKDRINVHGHLHNNSVGGNNEHLYKNVCVEKINYTPIHIEELRVK